MSTTTHFFNFKKRWIHATNTLLLCALSHTAHSEEFVLAVENDTALFSYGISLLKEAIKVMPGDHTLTITTKSDMSHSRIFENLISENSPYNIIISGLHPNRSKKALMVNYPISRGLLGHRMFIINKSDKHLIDNSRSLSELKKNLSIGSGHGWLDTDIFKQNGFRVEISGYKQLWKMLKYKRFTGFNRGLNEAHTEMAHYQKEYPNMMVHPTLIISYPFDYFFHLAPGNEKLQTLLNNAIKTLDQQNKLTPHFYNHPQIKNNLKHVKNHKNLTVYRIKHNHLSEFIDNIPAQYWHRF